MNNKEQLIKEIESFLAKLKEEDKPKVDFSILNDKDVFYIKNNSDYDYIFVGKDPINSKVHFLNPRHMYIGQNQLCHRRNVIELRKATDEEIALYRKHYPVKQKVWIEVYKTVHGDITNIIHESEKDLEYSLKLNTINGIQPLEVIEREY